MICKTIWKYQLKMEVGNLEFFEMPRGSDVVRVGMQKGIICIWACVLPDDDQIEKRLFYFSGTGMPVSVKDRYVGGTQDGEYEWHVWERTIF